MNTYVLFLLTTIFMAAQVNATDDDPRRRLRLRVPNDADTNQLELNGRVLQTSSMSMAIESIDKLGPNMEVIGTIVSKLEKEGESVDPAALMLALSAVEYDESPMHHYGDYDFTEECVKLLFIILPDDKASKLSFICGETSTSSTTTTAACIAEGAFCGGLGIPCCAGMYNYSYTLYCLTLTNNVC